MRRHLPSVASCLYNILQLLVLWIMIVAQEQDADRTIRRVKSDSGTQYLAHGYVATIPELRIARVTQRNMNFKSQSKTLAIVSSSIHRENQRNQIAPTTTNLHMCICINCARVINCSAYYFVETKHEQPHIAAQPTFTPRDGSPTIHVNIRTTDRTSLIDEGRRIDENKLIWSEETKLAQSESATMVGDKGETILPISTTYTEYDVVACADYMEDLDCWIRNMPDEIKRANPNFVPT